MKALSALLLLLCAPFAQASDTAPLDKPYKALVHPEVKAGAFVDASFRNNVIAVIAKQTPVKSQEDRGTCSIFSATALLESMVLIEGRARGNVDLSEEWLQYLVSQSTPEEGSESYANFVLLRTYGQPSEESLPYDGESWEEAHHERADRRCGHLTGWKHKSCLVSHRNPDLLSLSDRELHDRSSVHYDPEFARARREAFVNKERFFGGSTMGGRSGILRDTNQVKRALDRGIPLTLDLDFFYGAWNHRIAEKLGIGRDLSLWTRGIVTYPEFRSADRAYSGKEPAGHSVVVVGYDDGVEVTYTARMADGKRATFTRKGVYYFKNSWGTDSFGAEFKIGGRSFPGYGMITQDYAHEFGQFFYLNLR